MGGGAPGNLTAALGLHLERKRRRRGSDAGGCLSPAPLSAPGRPLSGPLVIALASSRTKPGDTSPSSSRLVLLPGPHGPSSAHWTACRLRGLPAPQTMGFRRPAGAGVSLQSSARPHSAVLGAQPPPGKTEGHGLFAKLLAPQQAGNRSVLLAVPEVSSPILAATSELRIHLTHLKNPLGLSFLLYKLENSLKGASRF